MKDGVCKQEVTKSTFLRHRPEVFFILRIDLDAQAHYWGGEGGGGGGDVREI